MEGKFDTRVKNIERGGIQWRKVFTVAGNEYKQEQGERELCAWALWEKSGEKQTRERDSSRAN